MDNPNADTSDLDKLRQQISGYQLLLKIIEPTIMANQDDPILLANFKAGVEEMNSLAAFVADLKSEDLPAATSRFMTSMKKFRELEVEMRMHKNQKNLVH